MANCWFCYKDAGENKYHEKCSRLFFDKDKIPELNLNKKLLEELIQKTVNNRIAVTGVQPKLSLTLEKYKGAARFTIVGLWGEFILKLEHDKYLFMPETEDLTMHIASIFKIPVCEHTLLEDNEGKKVYLAKRFDRKNGIKVHMEDLCQLSEFLTEQKYKGSYEKAGKLILKYCNNGIDILNYFEVVLFSYLTGNNDMHLKNFSILHTENGIRLSPANDLLNVNLLNPNDEEELGLTLNGKKKKIKLIDFINLGESLEIPQKAFQNSFKKFTLKNEEVENLINSSFLGIEQQNIFKKIWLSKQKIFDEL